MKTKEEQSKPQKKEQKRKGQTIKQQEKVMDK